MLVVPPQIIEGANHVLTVYGNEYTVAQNVYVETYTLASTSTVPLGATVVSGGLMVASGDFFLLSNVTAPCFTVSAWFIRACVQPMRLS